MEKTTLGYLNEVIKEQVDGLRILNEKLSKAETPYSREYRKNAKTACKLLMRLNNKQAAIEEHIRRQRRKCMKAEFDEALSAAHLIRERSGGIIESITEHQLNG